MLRFTPHATNRTFCIRVNPPTEERVQIAFDPAYAKFLALRR